MELKHIITDFEFNPKKLFLIDGWGAILSAFLLGVVLVELEQYFRIPSSTLFFLASFPVFFAIYDFYCYRNKQDQLAGALQGIAIANLLYCCLSIGLAFYHFSRITNLGWAYIILEVFVVVVLALVELQVAKRIMVKSDEK